MLNWEIIFKTILLIAAGTGVIYLINFFLAFFSKGRISFDDFSLFNIFIYIALFFTLFASFKSHNDLHLIIPAIWGIVLLYRKIKYRRWI